jgi:hypothetical protein
MLGHPIITLVTICKAFLEERELLRVIVFIM